MSDCTRIQTWGPACGVPSIRACWPSWSLQRLLFPFPKACVDLEVRRVSQAVQGGSRLAGMAASARWPGVCWVIDGHCSEARQCGWPPSAAVMRPRPRCPASSWARRSGWWNHSALSKPLHSARQTHSCAPAWARLCHKQISELVLDRKGWVHRRHSVLPRNGFHYVFPHRLRCFYSDTPCRRRLVLSNQNGCERRSVSLFIHFIRSFVQ